MRIFHISRRVKIKDLRKTIMEQKILILQIMQQRIICPLVMINSMKQ